MTLYARDKDIRGYAHAWGVSGLWAVGVGVWVFTLFEGGSPKTSRQAWPGAPPQEQRALCCAVCQPPNIK